MIPKDKSKFLMKLLKTFESLKGNIYHESRYCVMMIISKYTSNDLAVNVSEAICGEFIKILEEWEDVETEAEYLVPYTCQLICKDIEKLETKLDDRRIYFSQSQILELHDDQPDLKLEETVDFFVERPFAYFDDVCLFFKLLTGTHPPNPPVMSIETAFIALRSVAQYCTTPYWPKAMIIICKKFQIGHELDLDNLKNVKYWFNCVYYASLVLIVSERVSVEEDNVVEIKAVKDFIFYYFLENLALIAKHTNDFREVENEHIVSIRKSIMKIVDLTITVVSKRIINKLEFTDDLKVSFFNNIGIILQNFENSEEILFFGKSVIPLIKFKATPHNPEFCLNHFHYNLLLKVGESLSELSSCSDQFRKLILQLPDCLCDCLTPLEMFNLLFLDHETKDLWLVYQCAVKHIKFRPIFNQLNYNFAHLNERLINKKEVALFKLYKYFIIVLPYDNTKTLITTIMNIFEDSIPSVISILENASSDQSCATFFECISCFSSIKRLESLRLLHYLFLKDTNCLAERLYDNFHYLSSIYTQLINYENESCYKQQKFLTQMFCEKFVTTTNAVCNVINSPSPQQYSTRTLQNFKEMLFYLNQTTWLNLLNDDIEKILTAILTIQEMEDSQLDLVCDCVALSLCHYLPCQKHYKHILEIYQIPKPILNKEILKLLRLINLPKEQEKQRKYMEPLTEVADYKYPPHTNLIGEDTNYVTSYKHPKLFSDNTRRVVCKYITAILVSNTVSSFSEELLLLINCTDAFNPTYEDVCNLLLKCKANAIHGDSINSILLSFMKMMKGDANFFKFLFSNFYSEKTYQVEFLSSLAKFLPAASTAPNFSLRFPVYTVDKLHQLSIPAFEINLMSSYGITLENGIGLFFKLKINNFQVNKHQPRIHVATIGSFSSNLKYVLEIETETGNLIGELKCRGLLLQRNKIFYRKWKEEEWRSITLQMNLVVDENKEHYINCELSMNGKSKAFVYNSNEIGIDTMLKLTFDVAIGFLEFPDKPCISYDIANMFCFKGVLDEKNFLFLNSISSNVRNLMRSSSEVPYAFYNYYTIYNHDYFKNKPKFLKVIAEIMEAPEVCIRSLQKKTIFILDSSDPAHYCLSTLPVDQAPKDLNYLLTLIDLKREQISWHGPSRVINNYSFMHDLACLAPTKTLIYLYARSVELNFSGEAQSIALDILCTSVRNGIVSLAEYTTYGGIFIPLRIMTSKSAQIGSRDILAIASMAITQLYLSKEGNICASSGSVVADASVLVILFNSLNMWNVKKLETLSIFVQIIIDCITVGKCRNFQINRKQINCKNLIKTILDTFIAVSNESSAECEKFVECSLVLFKELSVMSSGSFAALYSLFRFVFLTHPANAVCFHYDPKSSESWIKFGDLYERSQLNLPMTKTTLSEYFTDLMKRNEKSQILKYYKDNNSSATAVRKKYIINDKARVLPEPRKFDSPSPVSDDFEESIKQQTIFNWMSALRGAILEFLSSTLVICSDSLMVQLQDALIWPAILVLLTEQTDVTIQTNTFKLLERFLNRAPDDVKIEFIQKGGFNVIACQLKHCHISLDIINSLFSMVCLETVNVAQGLDDTHIQSIPPNAITFSSFVAAHALLERSSEVGHPFDFWKVCCALMKIFEAQPMLRQVMMECNLMDSMFTALRNILNRNYILNHSAAMEAFTSFLHKIFNLSIPFDNVIFYEKCNSFVYKCMILEYIQPPSSFSNRKFRDIISSCLKWWLESIRDVFNDKYMVVSASRSGSPIDFEYDLEDEFDTESGTFENIPIPIPQFTFSVFQNNVQNKKNKKCVYKWKNQTIPESLDILSQRLNQALKFTSQYFLFHGHKNNDFIAAEELDAFSLHIKFLFHVWNKSSESCNNKKIGLDDWNKLLLMCKPKAGYYLLQLISCTLCSVEQKIELGTDYPLSPPIVSRQLRLLQMLINVMDTHKTSLMKLLDFDLDSQYFLNIGLHELALNPLPIEHEIPEFDESIDKLLQLLIAVKITTPFDDLSIDSKKHLISEETLGLKNYVDLKKQYISELRTKATTYQDIVEKYNSEQTEIAWACTRDVNSYQVFVRKIFGKSQIGVQKSLYEAEQFMFKLSQTLTHPAGPLANMESWPKGWCLDRTESDCRERRRLSPFNYNYGEKYVMDDQKESMGNAEPLPLSKLLNESTGGKDISIEYVKTVDSIKQSVTVSVIMPNLECNGELLLATECIYFFGETAKTSQKELECEPFTLSFECSKIREIYKRQYLLNDTALEVFFTDGETLLLAFQTISDRENAIGLIASLDLPNLIINLEGQLKNITQIWRKGIMTTFEYLMLLNKLAGRSYNDLMQYPVFPFIIADYVSDHLNLNVLSSFRNLQKPIAIQDKTKEDYYVKYFNDLQDEYDKFKASQNSKSANTNEKVSIFSTWPPYHYGSHYSNSGIITHYLVRLSPFTSVALEYQDDHFDIADRLFNSLETTWSLASSKSTTDFKELIPEFFYFPEFLENKNKLDLGVRQDSKRVCDVQLPPWVPNNNARLFTLINRQALESNIVSLHLHNWIDLTFGYKQNGDPAVKAVNVFHPLTYRGKCYEAMSENDQVIETALKTIVRTYGQMAAQLFQTAHLPRLNQTMQLNQIPIPSPLPTISGIKWGDYVGSPNAVIMEGSPFRLNISANGTEHFKLYDSSSNSASCVAVREGIILLKQQITNKKVYYIKETDQEVVAAVSWKNKSNILKVKFTHSENSWQNIWHMGYQTPTCINYSSCNNRLFVGFESGSIFVLQLNFTEKRCLVLCDFTNLLGHTASITSLSVSDMYSVIVSTSKDSKVCLWDSNKLTFIRNIELPPHSGVVELSDISSSSGDIVIIVNGKKLSQVMLFTINASLIGNIDSAIRISSISMTNLPEGISVNSLIVGLANGRVQLIEMWTMSIIREFQDEISLGKSVVNLLTTNSAKRLFVVYNDGTILCWQSAASNIRLPTVETMYIDVEQEVNLSFTDG